MPNKLMRLKRVKQIKATQARHTLSIRKTKTRHPTRLRTRPRFDTTAGKTRIYKHIGDTLVIVEEE